MTSALFLLVTTQIQQKRIPMVYDIEVAPNDQWMAVSNSSDNIWIYTLQGKLLRTLHHKKGSHLVDIEISPNGKLLVCNNMDYAGGYAPMWSTSTWKEVAKIGVWTNKTFCDPPGNIEFAGDSRYVIGSTLSSHQMVCWSATNGSVAYVAKKTRNAFNTFAIHNKSSLAVLGEVGALKLRFWDFENSSKGRLWGSEIMGIDPRAVRNPRFSRDGSRLFLISQPIKTYCMFNVLKPKDGKTTVVVENRIQGLQPRDSAWSGDDRVVWVCGLGGYILSFDPSSGALNKKWIGHNGGPVHALAATTRSHTVITASGNTMCVWNGDSGALLRTITLSKH